MLSGVASAWSIPHNDCTVYARAWVCLLSSHSVGIRHTSELVYYGVKGLYADTSTLCLIFDKVSELEERPSDKLDHVQACETSFLALHAFEVFKSNRFSSVFSLSTMTLRDLSLVYPCLKSGVSLPEVVEQSMRAKHSSGLSSLAQGNRPVRFYCDNEVLIQAVANKLQVFLCREPTIGQYIAIFYPISLANRQHVPHAGHFCHQTLVAWHNALTGLHIGIKDRFGDQLIRSRVCLNIQALRDSTQLSRLIPLTVRLTTVIIVPTDQSSFSICIRLFLDRSFIKDEHDIILFDVTDHTLRTCRHSVLPVIVCL